MDYVIEHNKDQQIIIVTAKGKWELEKDNEMIRQIMKAIEESGRKKVLVEYSGTSLRFAHDPSL